MPQLLAHCEEPSYPADPALLIRAGDYEYANNRARKHSVRHERGYEVASHFATVIAIGHRNRPPNLPELFRKTVQEWKQSTGHLSSITKAISHPSYLRIIGLAKLSNDHEIESLLLHELSEEPDHWFAALTAITGEDPVRPEHDFDQAVEAWLQWGRGRGILQS